MSSTENQASFPFELNLVMRVEKCTLDWEFGKERYSLQNFLQLSFYLYFQILNQMVVL